MTLLDKVLVKIANQYETYPALLLNDTHAIYFSDENITCSRVYPTSESSFLYIEEPEESFYLAMSVKVVNKEAQLHEVKELILNSSLLDFVTKIYKCDAEPNLNLIEQGDYRVKRV